MITLETVVGFAIRNPQVMDQLGEALRTDIVTANPYYRAIVEFADDFLLKKHKLPGHGDWETWLNTLPEGMLRDGSKEALGRLISADISGHDAEFFAEHVIVDLQRAAAQVVRARLNENPALEPKTLITLADKVAGICSGALQGLARLADIDVWAHPPREEEYISTGYPTLNRLIGGWGKELWILFADSGVGKSILLQNFSVNAAVRGKNVLHITLELGLKAQIQRYYRQIAEAPRADFVTKEAEVKQKLQHWFRMAKGQVYLLEYPAYSLDLEQLKRTVDRVARVMGTVDMLVLDYLDLMSPTTRSSKGGAYEDLGHMTHGVRGLSPLFDLTTLTASQAVRRPANAARLSMRDMGDSYNKVRGADGLISLVQTPDEEEVHQGRAGLLKVRDSGGRGQEVPLYINRDLALIQELDHPNTIQLMKRLGHLPVVGQPVGTVQQGGLLVTQ
jgi:KaiC/GvpD/RAD55 family RecA-like ATPase